MIVFYYDKTKAEQGIRFCLGQEDKILTQEEIKEQGKEELYANAVTYSSENNIPLTGYPIVEDTTVRNATIKELIDMDIMELEEGEILVGNNEIKKISQPSWQYKWVSPNWVIDESKLQDREVIYNGEIIYLEEGWYLENDELIKVERPIDMLKPIFNEKLHVWYESATEEELQEKYYSIINTSKAEILENGYLFIDTLKGKHQQKCRDKDLALLGNAIAAQEDMATFSPETSLKTLWAFNDRDTLEMNLTELKKLRLQGAMFVQAIFSIEAQLKSQENNIKLTKADFIKLINDNSEIKCWEENLSDTTDKTIGKNRNLSVITDKKRS